MEIHRLRDTELALSRVGLGCVTFGREIDENTSFKIMDYAVEKGITFFDTAEIYGGGASEAIIGRWLRTRGMAGKIGLVTKVSKPLTKCHINDALSRSRDRLGVDVIDAYLFHFADPSIALEEPLEALTGAVQEGKIRVAGCSNFSADYLSHALDISEQHGLTRLRIVQPIYNLVAREIEQELLPLAVKRDVAVVTYSPLGAGFLSGKYLSNHELIPRGSRFDVKPGHKDIYFKPENFRLLERLRSKAQSIGLPMVRLAIDWVFRNPSVTSVLVGARSIEQVSNALDACNTPLPIELHAEMNSWMR